MADNDSEDGLTSADNATNRDVIRKRHALKNIITLHGFIMVLAITNSFNEFATRQQSIGLPPGSLLQPFSATWIEWASFTICTLFIARFFLGDLMFLRLYDPSSRQIHWLDATNIFINAGLLAYMSFFVMYPASLFVLIFLVMVLELVWWIGAYFTYRKKRRDNRASSDDTRTQNAVPVSHNQSEAKKRQELLRNVDLGMCISFVTVAVILAYGFIRRDSNTYFDPLTPTMIEHLSIIFLTNMVLDIFAKGAMYLGGQPWKLAITSGD